MAIAGTRARLVTFEPTGPITARNVQDAIAEAAGGGGGGGGGGGVLQTAAVHVTAPEILAIGDGTPKVLVAAPDSDTVLIPQLIVSSYRAGEILYNTDPSLLVAWNGFGSYSFGITTGNTLTDVVDVVKFQPLAMTVEFAPDSGAAGSPQGEALVLTMALPSPFEEPFGDGTFDMTVYYTETGLAA